MTSYEVVLDNSKVLANCFDEAPPVSVLDIPAVLTGVGIYSSYLGGSACISVDDGGATYLRQHVGPVASGATGYNDNIRFPATSIPGEVESVSLITSTKGTDSRITEYEFAHGALILFTDVAFDTKVYYPILVTGSTYTELETPLAVDTDGRSYPITKAMLEAGTVHYNHSTHDALLNDVVARDWAPTAPEFDSYWNYIALRVYLA